MRLSLLLLIFCICFLGIGYSQSSFYKAKVSLKNEQVSKIKFYAFDNRYDITVLNAALKDTTIEEWDIFGGKDGRISQKERNGKSLFAVEMGQEYLEIMRVEGDLAVQYYWAMVYEADTILLKFPQSTRDQTVGVEVNLFSTTAHKRYKISGESQGKMQYMLGVEDLVSFSQIKHKSLHLAINTISSDCSEIVKVGGAFVTILEMLGRELENR